MRTTTDLPRRIHHSENGWIPMADGTRLAARIWLPDDAADHPVPAVLEYIPYRKRDGSRLRDETMHPYVAGHGYACVRVDLRGSGDSDGILTDEYLPQELDDGVEVIRWLAAQPWCTGRVGMIGISWGGFNGLQIAALRPPQLGAVISVCSTDDRYADDVHYMGGCLLGDNLSWASTMFSFNSLPPDPEIVGDDWRDLWLQRLEADRPWLEPWLEHQHRDDYWRHGSICENFSRVEVPVMAVSGWADGYSNAVLRLLQHLHGPRLGIIGPWSHKYPHLGVPGPAIGFLQESVRWWDHWLKGIETGIADEPMLRAWMLHSMPPSASYRQRYGHWVSEPSWPSPRIDERRYSFDDHRLVSGPVSEHHELAIRSPLSVGLFAGKWCSYSAPPDLPHDQREEDGGALVFTSDPLDEDLEVLGAPVVGLRVSADRPVAMVAIRLSDVQPDDKATRVTYGVLNLTHRDGHAAPEPLVPGRSYDVSVQLNDVAQHFPEGHRLRVSLSTSYFPLAWPPPEPVQLTIDTSASDLRLPVRRPAAESITFDESVGWPPGRCVRITGERHEWNVIRDLATDRSALEVIDDRGVCRLEDIDLTVGRSTREEYCHAADDFASVAGHTVQERTLSRGSWSIRTRTSTDLTCDADNFRLDAELDAHEGDRRVFSRNWSETIPRRLV